MKTVGPLLVIIVLLLFASCLPSDPGPPGEVGFKLSPQGEVAIRVGYCREDALITEVHLTMPTDRSGELGDSVWRIISASGSRERDFLIGSEPEDFDTAKTLEANLAPGVRYTVDVIFARAADMRSGFMPGRLRENVWFTSIASNVTDEEFDRLFSDACARD